MNQTFACSGLSCHNRVSESGQFCGSAECWPAITPPEDLLGTSDPIPLPVMSKSALKRTMHNKDESLQAQILKNAWKLNFGTAEEQSEALTTVIHLANQLKGK